uniref:SRCR domain-containing protein n=1 Tax=Sinocyclocheilus rhinocerous TaxID=307959 RepID=A0A673K0F5_9TELE
MTCSSWSPVRLVNGRNPCEGRVEVLHNGTWGTVCDDDWDMVDSNVVCRQLDCGVAVAVGSSSKFGQGSGPILLDNVDCKGGEMDLSQCRNQGWAVHNCYHYEDVAVTYGAVRLAGTGDRCQGRVEIYYQGSWGTVCDDDWSMVDAAVVCQEIGCGQAVGAPSNSYFGYGTGRILLDNVNCNGQEGSLATCYSLGWGVHNCGHHEDAGVICSEKPSIRLVNGLNSCQGRVEILYFTVWGTVCDDDWDMNNAQVVCRQMGCGPAIAAKPLAHFGYGSGPILLDNIDCSGSEQKLSDCFNLGWGQHNCGHYEDAGVICERTIRLVGGLNRCEGRVEIFLRGEWGTVCDDAWDIADAKVACRQMGCGLPRAAQVMAYFGPGRGSIQMDNLKCTGREATLTQCSHIAWNVHNCDHSEDAMGVEEFPGLV